MRWPNGEAACPRCGSLDAYYVKTRRIWQCKDCKRQFSVKLGTIFERSPIGLDKWLTAVWLLTSAKNGISSYELHRAIEVTQKTAWFMMHRIRLAMHTGSFEKMRGEVEVDETFIGGKARFMREGRKAKALTIKDRQLLASWDCRLFWRSKGPLGWPKGSNSTTRRQERRWTT